MNQSVLACAIGVVALGAVTPGAQSPAASTDVFEVTSVEQNRVGAGGEFQAGGRFRARNMTVRALVAAAYGAPQPLPLFRVVGGPGWIDSDRFDVDGVAAADVAASLVPLWPPRGKAMLRALLADRFKLAAREETREVPARDLVVV